MVFVQTKQACYHCGTILVESYCEFWCPVFGHDDDQSKSQLGGRAVERQIAAASLLNRYGWSLLDADELAQRATELDARSGGRQDAGHVCLQAYAAEMHRVITGDDKALCDQALNELWRYLVPIAAGKVGRTLGEELAQQALVAVWEKRQQCRYATSFLSWATMILINCVRQQFRRESRPGADPASPTRSESGRVHQTESMDDRWSHENEEEWTARQPAKDEPVDAALMREQTYRRLLDTLRAVLPSEDQVRVIVALFLEECRPVDLAQELRCTLQNVFVLKSRAMTRLRGNPQVIEALYDLVKVFPRRIGDEEEDHGRA